MSVTANSLGSDGVGMMPPADRINTLWSLVRASSAEGTIGRGGPAVVVLPPVIAIVAVPLGVDAPAAAIASAPASDWCSYCSPPPFTVRSDRLLHVMHRWAGSAS